MTQFRQTTCIFKVDERRDGKLRLVAVPAGGTDGQLSFELGPGFEINDAAALAEMMNTWVTHIRIDSVE